ncbi:ketopantoate reductase [Colwellia chukchiensis]|uniref:2-dehydropantoate 2-reductase n=1 Tax=Colwellia chukchiensis TaxID=641665 RepID=A0A1H7TGQ2_9GAMM|nr:2-dehydropantoate 2-reductase [Colwellia chukchiensis]SEL83893.1 ketopantoate reductase [Colwellia chukchiensis]
MHFVIVGCGAVGGYFGGRLAQHGENVTFVARGKQLQIMQRSGLTIKSIEGDTQLAKVNVIAPDKLKQACLPMAADVIFLSVKSYQLVSALAQIKPLIAKHTRVIPLLNGVNAVDVMQVQGIDLANIYGGLAKIIAEKTADGTIHHTGAKPHITLGVCSKVATTADTEQLSAIAKRLQLAGISVGVTRDMQLALWRKYIFVAAWGALAAAKNLTLGEIRAQSHLSFLLERIVNEYADIARAVGVKLSEKNIKETLSFLARLPDSSETSMQRDLKAASLSEFDVLVAYPLTLVQQLNLSAPVLKQCYEQIATSYPQLNIEQSS